MQPLFTASFIFVFHASHIPNKSIWDHLAGIYLKLQMLFTLYADMWQLLLSNDIDDKVTQQWHLHYVYIFLTYLSVRRNARFIRESLRHMTCLDIVTPHIIVTYQSIGTEHRSLADLLWDQGQCGYYKLYLI